MPESYSEYARREEKHKRIKGIAGSAIALAAVGGGVGAVLSNAELSENSKPPVTEVYQGTVRVSRDANIREYPEIPHGHDAPPNTYRGWPWDSNEIYITNAKIVESYNPQTGDQITGLWITFPINGDNKYVAWSPMNANLVSSVTDGKFIKGELTPEGNFDGKGKQDFAASELNVISVQPPQASQK